MDQQVARRVVFFSHRPAPVLCSTLGPVSFFLFGLPASEFPPVTPTIHVMRSITMDIITLRRANRFLQN